MFCKKCGAELKDGAKFCQNCGASYEEEAVSTANSNMETVSNEVGSQPAVNVEPTVQPVYDTQGQIPSQPNPVQPSDKKKDYIFIITIIVVGLALIAIPIILNMGNDTKKSNTNSNTGINSNSGYNTNTNGGSNYNSNSNGAGQSVTIGNYTFTLPKNAEIDRDGDSITFDHLRSEFDFGYLSIEEGSYDQLKSSKSLIQQYVQASTDEFVVGSIAVTTYNGVEFITIPLSQGGLSMVCGFAKLSDTEMVMAMVMSVDSNYNMKADYTLLNEMATIIKGAKRTGASGM